jgi:hypothetical protein
LFCLFYLNKFCLTRINTIIFTEELKRTEGLLHKQRQEIEQQEEQRLAREQERKKAEMRLELDRFLFCFFPSFPSFLS